MINHLAIIMDGKLVASKPYVSQYGYVERCRKIIS